MKTTPQNKSSTPKPKIYYEVRMECMLPATLTYKVLAEDEHQALELIKNMSPNTVKHKLIGRRNLKVIVYLAGSTMIKLIKNLL